MCLPNMFEQISLKFVRMLLDFCWLFSLLLKNALLMWEHELLFLDLPSPPSPSPQKKEIVDGHCFVSTSQN